MNIDLTEREIELLMGALGTNIETIKRRHNPADPMIADLITELFELETDFREALNRQDDGWNVAADAEINAETEMFNAGVEAREKMKATSRAAGRRALKLSAPGAPKDRTEMQGVDVWDPNDPKNW
jgi:hypothetical protein